MRRLSCRLKQPSMRARHPIDVVMWAASFGTLGLWCETG
jgi:hypothetical protein